MALVVEALAVASLMVWFIRRPAIGPRVVWLCEAVLDVVRLTDHFEAHLPRPGGVTVARLLGELDAVVGQDRVDPVRHRFQQVFQEFPSRPPVSLSTNCVTANLIVRSMPTNR